MLYAHRLLIYKHQLSPSYFFELVELHCSDHVMQQFSFNKYIPFDIDTSDQLHSINCSGRHVDYNWMTHHLWHISMWDALKNFIFREVHSVIYEEEYIG